MDIILELILDNIFWSILISVSLVIGIIWKDNSRFSQTFCSTIGVLGTFWGILVGLLDFNVSDIQGSVPILLEGLKTAFFTSIAGMIASMILKLIDKFRKSDAQENLSDTQLQIKYLEVISRKMEEVAFDFKDVKRELSEKTNRHLDNINHEIGIKSNEIVIELRKFSDDLSGKSTDAIIEALKQVMDEFNSKINDRLSDNIEKWSDATIELNEWQKQHVGLLQTLKETVVESEIKLSRLNDAIDRTSDSSNIIEEAGKNFNKMQQMLENNKSALKQVEDNLIKTSTSMHSAFREMNETVKTILDFVDKTSKSLEKDRDEIASMNQEIIGSMNSALRNFSGYLTGTLKHFNSEIEDLKRRRL